MQSLPVLTGKEEAGFQEGWVGCSQEQEALGHAHQLTRGDPCHGGVLRLPLSSSPESNKSFRSAQLFGPLTFFVLQF